MARLASCLVLVLTVALSSAVPSYLYPVEHRSAADGRTLTVLSGTSPGVEYQLVPSDEYAVTEYEPTIWDFLPSPVTAITVISGKAIAVVKFVIVKAIFVLIGVGAVFAFCGFTSYCKITFDKHSGFHHGYRALFETNPLDQIQSFVNTAIEKYRSFQDVKVAKA